MEKEWLGLMNMVIDYQKMGLVELASNERILIDSSLLF